jgi:hypothetical protein
MKKTIHKNYSLLVLVLLILYITYSNLPEDKTNNMTGGSRDTENPWEEMDIDELNNNLTKFSPLYSFLHNYGWVYWTIVGILSLLTISHAYTQYTIQGVPALGIQPGISWDGEGLEFLNYFYAMAKQKYGLFSPDHPVYVNDIVVEKFENDLTAFVQADNGNARKAIDTFCNVVSPCNLCNCSGPDPNYSGPLKYAPMIPFKGTDPNAGSCVPKNTTGQPSPADAANAIIQMQKSRGVSDLQFGRIPNCCCQLWKSQLGDASNFTTTKLEAFINNLPPTIGLSSATGCEPSNPGNSAPLKGKVNGQSSNIVPHLTPSLQNTYVYDMVLACGMKDKLPDIDADKFKFQSTTNTITGLSPAFLKCADYDISLDQGVSAHYVAKNVQKFITPSIGNYSSPSSSLGTAASDWDPDNRKYKSSGSKWTDGIWTQTSGIPPNLSTTKPNNWPTVAPFNQSGIVNKYWYKSSSGLSYELNVNNRLYEVAAYPVKVVDSTIYTTQLTDTTAVTYLDSFLSTSALAANTNIFVLGGSYYFP